MGFPFFEQLDTKYSPYNLMSVIGAITVPHLKSLSLDFRIIDARYPPYPYKKEANVSFN